MERIVTKMGEAGILALPEACRRVLGVEVGDYLVLVLEGRSVRVLALREAIRCAQALVRSYVPEGVRLSDELIQDRRGISRVE